MHSTIVINQSNLVPDGKNSSFVYKFPNSVQFPNHEIAVQQINMYYSWENINAVPLGNNTFSVKWGTLADSPYVIPDGLYEVSDINRFLQFQFIQQGKYLINSSGQNVYFAEFIVNPNLYAVQINTFPVPTAAGWTLNGAGTQYTGNVGTPYEGWTTPLADVASGTSAWVGFQGAVFNPQVTIPNNLNKIFGFTVPNPFVTALNTGVGTNLSYVSNVAPQVQPNSSAYLAISNIANPYSSPSSILYSVTPSVAFGEQISINVPEFAYNRLLNGTYNELRLEILGIDFQRLTILDPNMTIILVIRDLKEIAAADASRK